MISQTRRVISERFKFQNYITLEIALIYYFMLFYIISTVDSVKSLSLVRVHFSIGKEPQI